MSSPDNTLMLALLALDSYNRGYYAQLNMPSNQIGDATLITNDKNLPPGYFAAGFSASAYSLNGGIVISYRGTDSAGESLTAGGSDVLNGWVSATGTITSQLSMAMQFYQNVESQYPGMQVTLTGHSLGGGLAQAVSTVSGDPAVGFDWMPGDLAAAALAHNQPSHRA